MIPNDATTGMQLARQGRFAEALPYLERANRIAPTDAPILHATASLLVQAGRGSDAVERYRLAASLLPEDINVLCGWGRVLLLIGDHSEATCVFERALVLEPDYANPGGWLEEIVRETVEVDAACDVLHTLVVRHPLHSGLLGVYAKTLLVAERSQEAQAAYEGYRELRPQDPLPHYHLGGLALSRGDTEVASKHYRLALEGDPDHIGALAGIAEINNWRLEPDTLATVERLTQSVCNPGALARLHEILTRHHDRNGHFAAASGQAARMNILMKQNAPPRKRYDREQHQSRIDGMISASSPESFQSLRDAGNRERRLVFVIGLPRSGTTLLEQMLASHPGIVGVGEPRLAELSWRRALAASGGLQELLTPQAVDEAAAWHVQMLESRVRRLAIRQDGDRIVDKLPDNYLLAGWLHVAFPESAIIHCQRDPRDVALSCWLIQFGDVEWINDLEHIAHRIEQHRRLLRHWRSTIGDHLTEIRYERLVADPEKELRRVLAAIGIDWHPDVLAFADRKGFVASASRQQVREPIHARGVARWRNYEHALQPILPRLNAIAEQDALDASMSM